jgi:hypothetical protein
VEVVNDRNAQVTSAPSSPEQPPRRRSLWWWGPLERWRLQDSTTYS